MSERIETEIGLIPESWAVSTIGEIGDVTKLAGYEYTKHITYVEDGEIIALRALNVRDGVLDLTELKRIYKTVSDELPRSKLYTNDILFTYVGANIGQFALVPENEKFHLAPNICRIRCKEEYNPYFLYSYFRTYQFKKHLEGYVNGSSQGTLPMGNIRLLQIPKPPLNEQNNIVSTFSLLDDKITLLRGQNQTLEELAQTLFKRWFVEFEFPNENGQPYKSSGGKMVESELGEIPEGWEIKPLSSIADYLNGLACQKYPVVSDEEKLPVLKIKELGNGINDNTDWATSNVDEKYIIESGDVIFSWSGTLMLKIWDGERCVLNQHLFKVTSDAFPDWFIFQWTNFHLNHFIAVAKSKATTMGHIKRSHLDEAMCFVPTKGIFDQCNGAFTKILESFKNNNQEIQSLTQLRDTLLPKLMSGELRVKE